MVHLEFVLFLFHAILACFLVKDIPLSHPKMYSIKIQNFPAKIVGGAEGHKVAMKREYEPIRAAITNSFVSRTLISGLYS